jgi:MOSC domain-containing protein YiiM
MVLAPGSKVVSTALERVMVSLDGFQGDRHAGRTRPAGVRDKGIAKGTEIRNDRQATIVSLEELRQVAQALGVPEVLPVWLGANLALSGIRNLSALPPGTRLRFRDGVVLRVEGENKPCATPGEAIQAAYRLQQGLATMFPKVAVGLRGVVASVEQPGEISIGDWVERTRPETA